MSASTLKTWAVAALVVAAIGGFAGYRYFAIPTPTPPSPIEQARARADQSKQQQGAKTAADMPAAAKPLTVEEILARLKEADAMPDSAQKTALIEDLYSEWVGLDPMGALNSSLDRGAGVQSIVIRKATAHDAKAVWDWVTGLPESNPKGGLGWLEVAKQVIAAMSEGGMDEVAANWIDKMGAGDRIPLAGHLVSVWGTKAPEAVIAWIRSFVGADAAASYAWYALGGALAKGDVSKAMELINSQLDSIGTRMLSGATAKWVTDGDFEKLVEYARTNPGLSDVRHDTILESLGTALLPQTNDPALIRALGLEIRDSAVRDRFLNSSASKLQTKYPGEALQIAALISDSVTRERAASRAFETWTEKEPEKAQAFVSADTFPPDLARRVTAVASAKANDPELQSIAQKVAELKNAPPSLTDEEKMKAAYQKAQLDFQRTKREGQVLQSIKPSGQ